MAKKSNRLSTGKPGGGFGSRQHTRVEVHYGQQSKGRNPRAVSQIGQAMGNHATEHTGKMNRTEVMERMGSSAAPTAAGIRLGNELAGNVGKGGPGAGRTLYGQSGSNQTYGPVARGEGLPTPGSKITGHDILADYGPEIKRR